VLEVGEHTSTPPYASYNTGSLKWQKIPQSGPAQQMSLAFPDPFKVNVHNLVIKNVTGNGTSSFVGKDENGNDMHVVDYIKFDPFNENGGVSNPTISFTVEDKGAPGRYGWYIWIRGTDETGWYTYSTLSGILPQPGRKDVIINAPVSPDTQDNLLDKWGTYAFDLRVVKLGEHDVSGDTQDLRSHKISIPSTMPGVTTEEGLPRKGHEVEGWATLEEDYKWHASYYLQSDRDASRLKVEFLDPKLQIKSTLTQPLTKNTPHLNKFLYMPEEDDEAGEHRSIFVPVDAHKEQHRDHNNKAMLAVNKKKYRMKARALQAITSPDMIRWPAFFWKKIGFKPEVSATRKSGTEYLNTLKGSRLFSSFGHGNGGPTEGGGGVLSNGAIWANRRSQDTNAATNVYVSDLPANTLKDVNIAVFFHCWSAGNDDPHGNFIDVIKSKGASAVAGFNSEIPVEAANVFNFYLWESLSIGKRNQQHSVWNHVNLPQPSPGWNSSTLSVDPQELTSALDYAKKKYDNAEGYTYPNFDHYATNPSPSNARAARLQAFGQIWPSY
jgi:hypothetical protein